MRGAPADMGDWGVVRVFHEGGRLLRKHFGDFLPIMLVFIFPVCLINVCYTQFYLVDFFRLRSPTDPEPTPLLILRLLQFPVDLVYVLSWIAGISVTNQVVQDKIYVGDDETERHSESFYTTVKLAFTSATKTYTNLNLEFMATATKVYTTMKLAFTTTKAETETPAKLALTTTKVERETSASLNDRFRVSTQEAKFFKVLVPITVLAPLLIAIPTTAIQFTPESIAAMGLPPWTIFLFTLLVALYTTLATSYLQLVCVVGGVWSQSPQTPVLV